MIEDAKGRILLTRRHQKLRTYPHAWVAPGGSVDPGESLVEAGAREVLEETGLRVEPAALELIGLWESASPSTAQQCKAKGKSSDHFLIVYYRGKLDPSVDTDNLKLSENEVDAAVWVNYGNLQKAMSYDAAERSESSTIEAFPAAVRFSQLSGIYPNDEAEGIALGHAFILHKLLQRHNLPVGDGDQPEKANPLGVYFSAHGLTQFFNQLF
jgi:8-oxo-dGTP pyrophosphatase MutT (NUDIX family)